MVDTILVLFCFALFQSINGTTLPNYTDSKYRSHSTNHPFHLHFQLTAQSYQLYLLNVSQLCNFLHFYYHLAQGSTGESLMQHFLLVFFTHSSHFQFRTAFTLHPNNLFDMKIWLCPSLFKTLLCLLTVLIKKNITFAYYQKALQTLCSIISIPLRLWRSSRHLLQDICKCCFLCPQHYFQ